MGGSGKTVAVVSLARDSEVRAMFELVCYVPLGMKPDVHDLQRSLYVQLCGRAMDAATAADPSVASQALQRAAKGRAVLLVRLRKCEA